MRIASWNVNSIRARGPRLARWLANGAPDVLCLQETKIEDEGFPRDELAAAGFHAVVHGQRTYNGVAILSRSEATDVQVGLGDGEDDPQCRLIAATVDGVRVASVYVPNGSSLDSDKYAYKTRWLERLGAWIEREVDLAAPFALCGDFNIAPDERDVERPEAWADSVLFHPDMRQALAALLDRGLVDTYRLHEQAGGAYSWWDHRNLAFPKNDGLRIDLVLASRALAERCCAVGIDREERKKTTCPDRTTPSDHVPVWADFDRSGA